MYETSCICNYKIQLCPSLEILNKKSANLMLRLQKSVITAETRRVVVLGKIRGGRKDYGTEGCLS